jgi:hypothetical protein
MSSGTLPAERPLKLRTLIASAKRFLMRWSISRSKSSWRTNGYSLLRCALLLPRPTDIYDETRRQATLWDAGLRIAKPQSRVTP